jgi:hypothetical protein
MMFLAQFSSHLFLESSCHLFAAKFPMGKMGIELSQQTSEARVVIVLQPLSVELYRVTTKAGVFVGVKRANRA